jgi:energy-coupling factor transporter transmembrane protein EcfT
MLYPPVMLLALILSIIGTLITQNFILLGLGWLTVVLPLSVTSGILSKHMHFVCTIILPLTIALFTVWYLIIGAPPNTNVGTDPWGGFIYAVTTATRLLLLGGLAQIAVLPISPEQLPYVLSKLGLRGNSLIIVLSTFTLIPELNQRSIKILTARCARGLIKNRSILNKIRQLPYLIRPLLTGSLRTAIQRTEIWEEWDYFENLELLKISKTKTSFLLTYTYLFLALSWLAITIIVK